MPDQSARHAACDAGELHADDMVWLARILEVVRNRNGIDFSGYRLATLLRRTRNRMISVGTPHLSAYFEHLHDEPAEADALVQRLTIKVSRFFRDERTFDVLREALASRIAQAPLRPPSIWSAGCGHGEEAYSLAILLSELGQRPSPTTRDVVATDIDAAALRLAGSARYPATSLDAVGDDMRRRYFDEHAGAHGRLFSMKQELRDRVDLRLHDLTASQSPPDERRFDLVCCRNVLIYLRHALQERVEKLLLSSLLPAGLLCLGEAEWLLPSLEGLFDVVDRRARVFRLRQE